MKNKIHISKEAADYIHNLDRSRIIGMSTYELYKQYIDVSENTEPRRIFTSYVKNYFNLDARSVRNEDIVENCYLEHLSDKIEFSPQKLSERATLNKTDELIERYFISKSRSKFIGRFCIDVYEEYIRYTINKGFCRNYYKKQNIFYREITERFELTMEKENINGTIRTIFR